MHPKPQIAARISSRMELFHAVERITGVPHLAIIALWGSLDEFAVVAKKPGLGFFNLPKGETRELFKILLDFPRLTFEEAGRLAGKSTTSLMTACFIIAHKVKYSSLRVIYAEQDPEIVAEAVGKISPQAHKAYLKLVEGGLFE